MHSVLSISIRSEVKCLTQAELQTYRLFHGTLQALEQAAKQETTAQVAKITRPCRHCDAPAMFPKQKMPSSGACRRYHKAQQYTRTLDWGYWGAVRHEHEHEDAAVMGLTCAYSDSAELCREAVQAGRVSGQAFSRRLQLGWGRGVLLKAIKTRSCPSGCCCRWQCGKE